MKTGFRGTFVISWSQTDVDGLEAAPKLDTLNAGAAWAWRGDALRVDGPADVVAAWAEQTGQRPALRKRAARFRAQACRRGSAEHKPFLGSVDSDGRCR